MILPIYHIRITGVLVAISMASNSGLIYMILNFTSKEVGKYKYILLAFAVFNVLYSAVNISVLPVGYLRSGIVVYRHRHFIEFPNNRITPFLVIRMKESYYIARMCGNFFWRKRKTKEGTETFKMAGNQNTKETEMTHVRQFFKNCFYCTFSCSELCEQQNLPQINAHPHHNIA
ncbi:unnamed protein product [Heligmosomoides polygyrus]|uniref:G protein-coupled receptor n=1 Tax=Heligmosomoides polygyrus TaxID=6339 RepID=A0A183FKC7_HELPZ|nr:unnamed protein product [Heligmosomoides polygyrus]